MRRKKILLTGSAGFIGFHLCNFLLKKKFKVIGIDNYDNYYDIKIKKKEHLYLQVKRIFRSLN